MCWKGKRLRCCRVTSENEVARFCVSLRNNLRLEVEAGAKPGNIKEDKNMLETLMILSNIRDTQRFCIIFGSAYVGQFVGKMPTF
jgi:hypothetical protein